MDQPVYAEAVYVDGFGVSQNLSSRNHSARNISSRTLSPTSISTKDAAATKQFLNNNNWPIGLQNYIIQHSQKIACRYFILDDTVAVQWQVMMVKDFFDYLVLIISR